MSDLFKHRHAKLGCMVLRLFPKLMQTILKYYVTAQGLRRKYLQKDFRFVLTENEIVLMDKLPNMDEFTIEICYKILRSENMFDEPKCKWGNVPHYTEIEIADDIQRLIKATNSISGIKSEEVTDHYAEELLEEIKLIVTRIDSYLEQDTLGSIYNSLCRSETDCISILQDLTSVKIIEESLTNTESTKRERFSRLSIPIIETFPKILRDVIGKIITAKQLYQKCTRVLNTFYPEQQTNIKELQNSNTYGSLDVTLICTLLKRFALIPPPKKGWGRLPDKVDIKLGDDVERIRCYRNKLAHRSDTKVDKKEFSELFDEFRDIGYRMDQNSRQTTNYEQEIIGYRTCGMDTAMQAKYENAMKEIENIKLRYEKRPIKVYWGESFDRSLMNLRSLLKDSKLEGRQEIRLQIVFQNEDDVEINIKVLNSLTAEINEGLTGIEFKVATQGSVVLNVDLLLEIFETDDKLLTTLALFLEKILARSTVFPTKTIDIVLLPVEENTQWNKPKTMGEQVYLEFDIEAQLLENDDIMVDQLGKISDAIIKHSNGSGTNQNITAILLPINLENITLKEDVFSYAKTQNTTTTEESLTQAQTPVYFHLPVSVTLRQQFNIKKSGYAILDICCCIKTGNKLVFLECFQRRMTICNVDSTDLQELDLDGRPWFITKVHSNTVAVSCKHDDTILIIDISPVSLTSKIKTSGYCSGISYNENKLYVIIDDSIIHVMDLKGGIIRTITLPVDNIREITVHRDRLLCINGTSVYCCSLDGKLIWKFTEDKYQGLCRFTTDDEGNVYFTCYNTNNVVVISNDGYHNREILTKSDGLNLPIGIYFDKKENILLVCNSFNGKAFVFDIKK